MPVTLHLEHNCKMFFCFIEIGSHYVADLLFSCPSLQSDGMTAIHYDAQKNHFKYQKSIRADDISSGIECWPSTFSFNLQLHNK